MELAGLEPATSWVRSSRNGRGKPPGRAGFAGLESPRNTSRNILTGVLHCDNDIRRVRPGASPHGRTARLDSRTRPSTYPQDSGSFTARAGLEAVPHVWSTDFETPYAPKESVRDGLPTVSSSPGYGRSHEGCRAAFECLG